MSKPYHEVYPAKIANHLVRVQKREIERLKNNWDKLEKWLDSEKDTCIMCGMYDDTYKSTNLYNDIMEKIKELRSDQKQMTLEEKYKKVFDYFGYENQRRKLNEEVQELNDEILLYEKGEGDIKNVITEMGDVCNIIRGFMYAYDISQEKLTSSMDDKMDRTVERIDNDYYKSDVI